MRGLIVRLATVIVAFVLASVGLILALGFAMVGVYFLFLQIVSPAWAAFDSALTAVVLSFFVLGIAYLMSRRPRRRAAGSDPNYLAAVLGGELGHRFQKLTGVDIRVLRGGLRRRRKLQAARLSFRSRSLTAIPRPQSRAREGALFGL